MKTSTILLLDTVWWDYHIFYVDEKRQVWDADCRLGVPVSAHAYLKATFRNPVLTQFRMIEQQGRETTGLTGSENRNPL